MKSNTSSASSGRSKLLVSGFLSNFFEFYDFTLYAAFALPLAKAFFPSDEFSSIIKSLTVFGIAFFARPFGSFFFGYLGDTKGRRISLMLSLLLMSLSTFIIGCLPTYNEVGVFATILLILCRLLQGFSLGGESTGSFIFLLEHIGKNRGLIGATVLASGTLGMIFATLQGVIFTQKNMPEWSWRIPFWLGSFMGVIGVYIRYCLAETREFLTSERHGTVFEQLQELAKWRKEILCTIGIGGASSVFVYTLLVYFNVYLNQFAKFSVSHSLLYSQIGLIACLFTVPFMGYIADKFTYQRLMKYACYAGFCAAILVPYFMHQEFFVLAVLVLALIIGAFNGPSPALINSIFPIHVKYLATSVGFSLGTAIFGGSCPAIYSYLTKYYESTFILIPCLVVTSMVGLVSVSTVFKRGGKYG